MTSEATQFFTECGRNLHRHHQVPLRATTLACIYKVIYQARSLFPPASGWAGNFGPEQLFRCKRVILNLTNCQGMPMMDDMAADGRLNRHGTSKSKSTPEFSSPRSSFLFPSIKLPSPHYLFFCQSLNLKLYLK